MNDMQGSIPRRRLRRRHREVMLPGSSIGVEQSVSTGCGRVGRKDTVPEMVVRRLLFAKGLRYRLHLSTCLARRISAFRSEKSNLRARCFWAQTRRLPPCKFCRGHGRATAGKVSQEHGPRSTKRFQPVASSVSSQTCTGATFMSVPEAPRARRLLFFAGGKQISGEPGKVLR